MWFKETLTSFVLNKASTERMNQRNIQQLSSSIRLPLKNNQMDMIYLHLLHEKGFIRKLCLLKVEILKTCNDMFRWRLLIPKDYHL